MHKNSKYGSSNKMHVVIVVTALITAQNFVVGFAQHLIDQGFEVTLVCDEGDKVVLPSGSKIECVALPMRRDPHPLHDLVSLVRLTKLLAVKKPQVVMYATPKASLLSSLSARVIGVPVRVYQLWGLRLETSSGLFNRFLSVAERITSACSTAIIANSFSLAQRYESLALNGSRHVEVFGQGSSHGVDIKRYSERISIDDLDLAIRERLALPAEITLGFVGRLHPDKGLGDLVQALKICHLEGVSVTTIVVGDNEGFTFPPEVLSNTFGQVILLENVSDPRPIYGAIDVLVLPSLREGFPNVVLEAAAMGVPAIVTNATGVRDSVLQGQTGSIVPVQDPAALAAQITWHARNREASRTLGANARINVVQNYDQEKVWANTSRFLLVQNEGANIS